MFQTTDYVIGWANILGVFGLCIGVVGLAKGGFSIETLLIDEGFGALDRNYVEMAVDTLELLKHRGVQVGLISHVVALQEKIATSVTIDELKFLELDVDKENTSTALTGDRDARNS